MAGFVLTSLLGAVEKAVRETHPGLELETEVDADLPTRWCEGGVRLRSALTVLLGHAVAAGDDERARIAVRCAGGVGGRRRLRIEVHDLAPYTGRESLADPDRISPTQLRRIVRSVTQEHGMVRSAVRGDVWWFVVSLRADAGELIEQEEARPRVLVVDDNAVNRRVATHMLTRLGCEVESVDDGAQAVARHRPGAYELILMDCQMPVMDGFEATQRIRTAEGDGTRTPIVAWTSHALEDNRRRCLAHGMDGFVAKPAGPVEMERVVTNWTRRA